MIKRQNSINLSGILAKKNSFGLLICLNCDKLLPKRRQKYCSYDCSYEWGTKHNHQLMRGKFINKTKGFCNICKNQPLKKQDVPFHLNIKECEEYKAIFDIIKDEGNYFFILDESKLILDHIKPIALGGGEFDEDNLQILCRECDKIKTKKDHVEIAKARRLEKGLSPFQSRLILQNRKD